MGESSRGDAIVIGASLAGLWTARVLADHFGQVTLLERDRLPDGPAARPGVPQDRHVHVLLERGARIMATLFPGIEEELLAAGAHRFDLTRDTRTRLRGQWLQRYASSRLTFACSRVLLESILRRRVATLPNVALRSGAQVQGLAAQAGRVTGVHVRWKEGRGESVESADLLVDASGRSSRTPGWLAELGYERPNESLIDVRLGYAGRRYRQPVNPAIDWQAMLIGADQMNGRRSGLIYGEEQGIWMVMLAGILGDYPPTDAAGFIDFARSIHPDFFAAISAAEPVGPIIGYRQTENRFRHYERLRRWPDRFVVMGDAVCGFNPIYGQGMTVAAMAAEALGRALTAACGQLDGLAWRFQRAYPKVVEPAWLLATSADLEWLGGKEATSLAERLAGWYMPKVLDAIPADRVVHQTFLEVQNLMQLPAALFHPRVALRVLAAQLQARRRPAAQPVS